MACDYSLSRKSKLTVCATKGGTYKDVPFMNDIAFAFTAQTEDVSTIIDLRTDEGWRKHVTTGKELGDLSLEFHKSEDSDHKAVMTIFKTAFDEACTSIFIKFYPTGETNYTQYEVIVTSYEEGAPLAGLMTIKLNLKVTGKPTTGSE